MLACWIDAKGAAGLIRGGRLLPLLLLSQALAGGPVAAQEDQAAPVKVARAVMAPVREELPLTGSVTARRLSRISPEVAGLVAAVRVDEGDEVRQGEVLLELDRTIADLEYAGAQARVKEAQAQAAEAARQRDEAAELVKKKHIASTRYEAARAAAEINAAALERLQAELGRQGELLRRRAVRAPFAGVITKKMIEKGEWVKTDANLFELAEVRRLRIIVPVPQFYFNEVRVGAAARVAFDAYPGRSFPAQVSMKVPLSNEAARTFPVRIDLENEAGLFAPGMSARVVFQLGDPAAELALLLPRDAIVRRADGSQVVWVVRGEAGRLRAQPVEVQTGRASRQNIEIIGGAVRAGDRVVARGNEILRPGQLVEIKEELPVNLPLSGLGVAGAGNPRASAASN